jgi:transglutaminase-like putative cysteine protease
MIRLLWMFTLVSLVAVPTTARAQFKTDATGKGPQLGAAKTKKYKCGVQITARGGPCKGIRATIPIPMDWPEQQVQVLSEDLSPTVRSVNYRTVGGGAKQMIVEVPLLPAGEEAHALVTFEVTRHTLLPPTQTDELVVPKKLPRDVLIFTGPSPYIESRNAKIISISKQIVAEKEGGWAKVEAIYDWVRENVKYENGELKGAIKALNDKTGDCEELSSLIIALCRAQKIPARTVWVPEHCYPEFYLDDAEGHGHWFPCQAAGSRAFGGIPEERPILQKGDNFRDPDRPKEKLRYVSEYLTGKGGGGRPKVKFVREEVAN